VALFLLADIRPRGYGILTMRLKRNTPSPSLPTVAAEYVGPNHDCLGRFGVIKKGDKVVLTTQEVDNIKKTENKNFKIIGVVEPQAFTKKGLAKQPKKAKPAAEETPSEKPKATATRRRSTPKKGTK
jgi:hypothetical protein